VFTILILHIVFWPPVITGQPQPWQPTPHLPHNPVTVAYQGQHRPM